MRANMHRLPPLPSTSFRPPASTHRIGTTCACQEVYFCECASVLAMRNNETFTITHPQDLRVVIPALGLQTFSRRSLLVRPHRHVDRGLDGGNGVGRRPHVTCDPTREHRGVQPAPACEVRPVLRPALGNVVLDRFHEIVPQCPSLAVDLGHRLDVHVGPRLVCASRWRELGHACNATAQMQRTVVQTCNGGTGFVIATVFAERQDPSPVSSTRVEIRSVTRGGAK